MDIVKVQLSFQLNPDGDILRRRKLLTFQSKDTLECVCGTVSGQFGGPPLWPKGFFQKLEQGGLARIFLQRGETNAGASWCNAPVQAMLGDLVNMHEPDGVLAVLLCIEQPKEAILSLESVEAKQGSKQSAPGSGHVVADDVASTQMERGSCYSNGTEGASASLQDANGNSMAEHEGRGAKTADAGGTLACRGGRNDGDGMLYMPHAKHNSQPNCSQRGEDEQVPCLPGAGHVIEQQRESAESESSSDSGPHVCHQDTLTLQNQVQADACMVADTCSRQDQVQAHACMVAGFGQSYMIHPVSVGGHYSCLPEQMMTSPYGGAATAAGVPMRLPMLAMVPSASSIVATAPSTTSADTLFNMVSHGDVQGVKRLLSLGVDINACTAGGSRVLFRAVIKARDPELVWFLLLANADVRACDDKGNQVMHFWARATVGRQHLLEIGKSLVHARADVNSQRAQDCMTPLHHIVVSHNSRRGWFDFHKALFLTRCGADIRLATSTNQFPCNLVNMDGRGSTRKLLQLLTAGVRRISAGTILPRCEVESCPWCQ